MTLLRQSSPSGALMTAGDHPATAAYLLESLQRLKQAAEGALHVVEMFDSQGSVAERLVYEQVN